MIAAGARLIIDVVSRPLGRACGAGDASEVGGGGQTGNPDVIGGGIDGNGGASVADGERDGSSVEGNDIAG